MDISIWVTSNCNLNCSYCYEKCFDSKNKGSMSLEIEDSIIDYVKKHEPNIVLFHGGEPLLNYQFIIKIVRTLQPYFPNVQYGFTTNGTIWNDEIEFFLKEYVNAFHNWTSVSIDGKKESNDRNRYANQGESIFERLHCTTNRMLTIFPHLRARMTVTPETSHELSDNVIYLARMGFRMIVVAFDIFRSDWTDQLIETLSAEYDKVIYFWKDHADVDISIIEELKHKKSLGGCIPSCNINFDGNIYPCTYVVGNGNYRMGNVKDGLDQNVYQNVISIGKKDNSSCQQCTNKMGCTYNRCKLINKNITGDYYQPCETGCAFENFKVRKYIEYRDMMRCLN